MGKQLACWSMIGAVTASVLCGGGADAFAASGVRALEVVSNRADLISGGDALVAARLADGTDPAARARRRRRRRRHAPRSRVRPNGRFEGLVTGLASSAPTR